MAKKEEQVDNTSPLNKISREQAGQQVLDLVEKWYKLKNDLKETQAAYKEKIKQLEEEIIGTLNSAEDA